MAKRAETILQQRANALLKKARNKRKKKLKLSREELRAIDREEKRIEAEYREKIFDEGILQKTLVEKIPGLAKSTLQGWETEGLKGLTKSRRKFYPVFQLIAFMHSKYVNGGRRSDPKTEQLLDWKTHELEFKAKKAEQEFLTRQGMLISKEETEETITAILVEVKAAFLSMPGEIAAQLEGLDRHQITEVLTKHARWKVDQFSKGRVPVSDTIYKEIKKLFKKLFKIII